MLAHFRRRKCIFYSYDVQICPPKGINNRSLDGPFIYSINNFNNTSRRLEKLLSTIHVLPAPLHPQVVLHFQKLPLSKNQIVS